MGKADTEIQTILSHLTVIYWRNIDTITGRSRRPSGADWIQFDRLVHRLLILRGTIKMDEKVPEDPWQLFLNEYAPVDTTHPTMEKPSPFQSYPNSILLRSASSYSSAGSCGQNQHQQQNQHQHGQGGRQGENHGSNHQQQGGVESERHIRFDSNLPGRMRHRRFPVSPAPHSRV